MRVHVLVAGVFVSGCSSPAGPGAGGETGGIFTAGDGDGDSGDADAGDGDGDGGPGDGDPGDGDPGDGDPGDGDPGDGDGGSGTKFDLTPVPDNSGAGGCQVPPHTACDADSTDAWHALGINCPGELAFTTSYTGDAQQLYVHTGNLGTYDPPTYPPLEGDKMVILSSGMAMEMTTTGDKFASTSVNGNFQETPLPPPLNMMAVDPVDTCTDNPNLVGTGDCSNTLQEQWDQGYGAFDYAELRMEGEVPMGASGFEYHLAFFSTEYPNYYQSSYNDMYVAWLESELWTGNISFDEMGNPISLNAGFLDYKDAPNNFDCPAPCTAPELQGTVMETHAGTKWLTTTAGVTPGEEVTIVWAIWDLSDEVLDSVVILDDFRWNCEGGPPQTIPG
jgi:hypothetical protein